ncbi:protein kinase domain-containing protein [Nonomuraea cavernae]|nr:protein kinase [Nonomuraea cavernae]MCA2185861.1 protein kinase [Nonomuraea cavernae]
MGKTTKLAGRYRLLDPLGGGVARPAFDELEHRDVTVRAVHVPPELRDAAVRDARRAIGLRHASIVGVLDVVVEKGEPWLVTESATGASLERTVLSRHPLPVLQAARVGVCVLSALLAAHAEGIVHGRVNPANVLLTSTGRALLSGFGFPDPGLSPASDLWSLAATLHFAVEGRPPGPAPVAGADPLRSLIRAMLDPAGPPPAEVVAETLDRLALDRSLDQVIASSGAVPIGQVVAIGLAVLDQLAAIHSRGRHHGAVHPGMVLLPAGGAPARLRSARVAGPPMPDYTAPEGVASQAADLWSLGATLFAAVEGRSPAPGAPLTRAGTLAPVLFRLLSGDPAQRGDLAELRQELLAVGAEAEGLRTGSR